MQHSDKVRILFVCLGNICRSPMAEAVFSHLVKEAGLSDRILVDSAGTSDWHVGERAHPGTRGILAQHNIRYDGRARQITDADLRDFDYILAMDRHNLADLRVLANGTTDAEIRLFMDYANGVRERDVPDPYLTGRFEEVYRLVRAAAEGLLAHIRERHGL